MIYQEEISIRVAGRGYHLVTRQIIESLPSLPDTGMLNVFMKHTSAGLTLNEDADPSVRVDFEGFMNKLIPENDPVYTHTLEGSDDMPAHLKASLLGNSLTIPITDGRLNLGTWQGIYLCEYRDYGGSRNIVLTVYS